MKKIMKLASIMFVAAVGLTGCNTTSASTSTGTSTDTSTSTSTSTAEDLSKYDFTIKIGSPAAEVDWVKTQVTNYVTSLGYTNVTVQPYALEENEADSKVSDWSVGPDVYAFAGDKILNLMASGALAKVNSADLATMTTSLGEDVVAAATLGDAGTYGYPFTTNTYFMYNNTSLVPADKTTNTEDIIAACTSKSVKYNYPLKNSWYGIPFLSTYGAKWNITLSEDGKSINSIAADFNGENGIKAAKELVKLCKNANVDVTEDSGKTCTVSNAYGATVSGAWRSSDMKKDLGDNYGVARLPKLGNAESTDYCHNFLGYKLYGINPKAYGTDTARALLDQKIATYLISKDAQIGRYTELGTSPVNKEALASDAIKDDVIVAAVAAQIPTSVAQTVVPSGCWAANDALYTSISSATGDISDETLKGWLDTFNAAICNVGK
ncbi:MAG: extracellular solute-binding protein [Bacilli bacterium]